ncbi:MAG: GntR family transcriptional regulator [Maritimibacter sp.]|nr:GntR family transcriptional regulator [Maritimibacter sp.]
MTLQAINPPESLTEVTAARIRDAIVSGELPLGSKLSEQRLADSLQVSRSPVRDALAALQTEGLVNVSPKRGTFVFAPDLRVVDELCEHRAVLETAALRKAIVSNHAELMRKLEEASAAMQKALDANDPHGYTTGDQKFHKAIVESCKNRSIIKSYAHTISPLKALRTHLFTIMDESTERSMGEHMGLLAACRDHQVDMAVDLLADHVGHLVEAFRAKLDAETAP